MAYGSVRNRRKRRMGVSQGRPFRESGGPLKQAARPPKNRGKGRAARPQQQITPPQAPAYTPPAAAPTLSGGTGGYDINSDPAVAAASGLAAKMRAMAQATALAKRKQAAIEYGETEGIEGLDEATMKAARENPFSVTKRLQSGYETGVRDLDEGLNSANLFYSGYRGQQLGEAAKGFQQSKYNAATGFKGLLTDIGDQLANSLMSADSMEADAYGDSDGGDYDPGYDDYYEEPPPNSYTPPGGTPKNQGPKPKPKPKPRVYTNPQRARRIGVDPRSGRPTGESGRRNIPTVQQRQARRRRKK